MTNDEIKKTFLVSGNKKLIGRNEDNICLFRVTPRNGQPEYYEVRKLKIAENRIDDSLELIYTFLL